MSWLDQPGCRTNSSRSETEALDVGKGQSVRSTLIVAQSSARDEACALLGGSSPSDEPEAIALAGGQLLHPV